MRISLTALDATGSRDVLVSGDPDMPVSAVARALSGLERGEALAPNVVQLQQPFYADGRMLDPSAPAARELPDGSLVTLDGRMVPATMRSEPSGMVEVRVVGGRDAGGVHRLGPGNAQVHPGVFLTVRRDGVRVRAEVPATLDGEPLEGAAGDEREWPEGGMLAVGPTVLALARSAAPDTHLEALPQGLAFNRPPRIEPARERLRLKAPHLPEKQGRERLRLFGALLFSVFGLVMAYVLGQWYWALFALAWPLMLVGEWIGDRLYGRKSYKKAYKEYQVKSAFFARDLEKLRRSDERDRRASSPDPAEVLLTATGPRRRLWERRLTDPDALHLRVGLADLPARVDLRGNEDDVREALDRAGLTGLPLARHVPVTLPFPDYGVVGITGPREHSRGLARWLVAQAAALHTPRDLAIVVLSADGLAAGGTGGAHWNWTRWLPHCAPRDGEECLALIGDDPVSVAARVTELAVKITERRRAKQPAFGTAPEGPPAPAVLLVLDGARALRRVPGMPQVLAHGAEAGIYALCLDDEDRLLPEECTVAAAWDGDHVRLRGRGLEDTGPVLADRVPLGWAERFARSLAPVKDVSREDSAEAVPASVKLLDLLGMPDPSPARILDSWARREGPGTRVPIGVTGGGPFEIDLAADGPHGLIAGTTGAGKSELLQTLIAALAVRNRPDEMTFVLIDYKGGAAFKDCAALPHTVGMVTDLDGRLTARALDSLAAELRRREHVLARAGAKDIEDFHAAGGLGLARLVLVIDEFAAMAAELPGFVDGLVDIGRRGRSLGVHLILATQRPAGVVTADIRANTNLRVALRVTDAEDSTDVIDLPDAARIAKATPGRCFVRTGAASPWAVQSARIGGRRGATARPTEAKALAWAQLGHPLPEPAEDQDGQATDLSVLVAAIAEAAKRAGIARQPSPWLTPLPEAVVLSPRSAPGGSVAAVPPLEFGVSDLPARQTREPLALDLEADGHLYLAGAAQSGRTTALRSLAGALAASATPYDVHLYAIDCGGNGLAPLVALPHCGAVVTRDSYDRVERLLNALTAEVSRRQGLLSAAGFATLAEQRATVSAGDRLPWMVLLLDRWEGYTAAFEHYDYGRLVNALLRLLQEGAAVGLRAVVAGDRSGLLGQAATVFDRRLVLRMGDPADYGYAGVPENQVPAHMPPGRALRAVPGGPIIEAQIGLLGQDPSGTAQVAALQEAAEAARARYGRVVPGPLRVDELPARITAEEALALDPAGPPTGPLWCLVGAGGDTLGPLGVDLLEEGPSFVVAGPTRSGRSSALETIGRTLLARGVPLLVLTPRRSPLRALKDVPGVLGVLDATADRAELDELVAPEHRFALLVDDAELIDDTDLGDAVQAVLRAARDGEHAVVIAGNTEDLSRGYRGFLSDARKNRTGLLLGISSPDDGELFGLRLPRNAAYTGPVGRGLLIRAGTPVPVQAALPPTPADD
ncbi:S-DNA-T family DNA segregation ATPase FtsK/SpoIIIE [Actinocorallia herbida]|uniref:S-DNA-T family DNA segregation ATPase FtsK/SpoIIIE n=1 Tax=Actinocorallia herbida TaxID=58109 RepID=A0A3N1D999_9ACTN|nr:FtsK/SpoIIIE domain-containing protein [Actinocorallia herbida]ROO90105.1 S-DNA-T family DNA segregation ATPase FtsK/SpoIIIE [Actinocorallia herbida]